MDTVKLRMKQEKGERTHPGVRPFPFFLLSFG
jgi:hypothetical protein